ncbi:MAG TPA: hypothetical protein VMI13_10985 [Solirubrobacteraceae bacterium]|nr:hypothetical protein [Solirubrobacteraceae bacterium]
MSGAALLALVRRTFADARGRNIGFALLFALVAYAQPAAYRSDYPTLRDRLGFVHAFAGNASLRLFYGRPVDLLSVGGYSAWRVGGILAIFAAVWGMLAAARALRAEEDSGRTEILAAGPVSRARLFAASVCGCLGGVLVLWVALLAGLLAGGLPAGGSAYLALATVVPALVFLALGALACQLGSSRRVALELTGAALVVALLLRVVADTTTSLGWLRWLTPLGWSEELRAFAGPQAWVIALPAVVSLACLLGAARLWLGRDVGRGLIGAREVAPVRLSGLSSPTALALREERWSLGGWLLGSGSFAFIIGLISTSISSAGISSSLRRQLKALGGASITKPAGYIGLSFLFFVLAFSLFACSQVAAARHEEAQERLDVILALPVSRARWLVGRLGLAVGGLLALSLAAGLLAWVGADVQHAGISLATMIEAGLNCAPVAILFLSFAALAYALVPRASTAVAFSVVSVTFVWQLLSSIVGAPSWLRELSPFEHVGLVPAQPLKGGAAAAMLGLAVLVGAAAVWVFTRRDLVGA